jgi:type II secretory pathway component GspD/PulD (secretin)
MAKLTRGGLILPLLLLIMTGMFPAGLSAQDEQPFKPNPEDPITVDFVQKDLHTVMHYIALRSGLQIIVEGEVNVKLTVMFRDVIPRDAIQSICKANKLDFIEDGSVIIIKRRPQEAALANVVKGEIEGRFNVNFESHELVAAIMEVASVTRAQVFVPAVPPQDQDQAPRRGDDEEEQTRRVIQIQERKISIYMREALPSMILKRLAELGDLIFEEKAIDNAVPGADVGYEFKYRATRAVEIDTVDPQKPISSRDWVIPGADMVKVKSEVQNLLSPVGKLVADDVTDFLMVRDYADNIAVVAAFLDPLVKLLNEKAAVEADKVDNLIVREYRLIRNAGDATILGQIREVLSDNGRVVSNPDRNSLIVYEVESRIKDIDTIMLAMDTAPEQVLITAKLVEVSLDDYMGYGLELFTSHSADNLNDGRFTGSSQDQSGTVGGLFGQPTGFDPFFATFTNPRIDVRLELLANEGRVETLSQPTQMVSNRQRARIEVGQEIPYLESSGATGGTTTASVSFKEVSIVMEVTPTVLENGLIRLEVTVTVREVIGNVAIEGNNTPVLSKRESKTDVFIRDGETLVMGGLIRERERTEENGLPFLKDIPFLGYLFKSANRTTSKTDLLFFLRPQIVNVVQGAQISENGESVERDLRPLIYEEGDQKKSNIRDGRFRKLEIAPKPAWYNDKARPKTGAEVKPGA